MQEPTSVADVMRLLDIWWAVAGGWAIDLWIGATTREHHDVEVVTRRDDQARVHALLRERWELRCIDPPGSGWRAWPDDDPIALPSFQLQARTTAAAFDLFLESTHDDVWVFRRDARIRRPLDEVTVVTESGIPVVAPEIQLLYTAKSGELKNQHDFDAARPMLTAAAVAWLGQALAVAHPGHPWLAVLP